MSFHGGESFAPLAVHVLYPPLSLPCQRKSAVHRGERNRFLPQILALAGLGLLMCGSCWSELLTGSGSLLPDALHSFPRESSSPHLVALVFTPGGQGQSALLTPLPLPRRKEAVPNRAYPRGRNPKEGARRPLPLSRFKGVRGEIAEALPGRSFAGTTYLRGMKSRIRGPRPPWSGRFKGVWGEFRNPPTFLVGVRGRGLCTKDLSPESLSTIVNGAKIYQPSGPYISPPGPYIFNSCGRF